MPKINRTSGSYTIVENECLRDINLDISERGLLVTMLSLPDGWEFSGVGLTSILPCGKTKVFNSLRKLEEAGYLQRERVYKNGKVVDWIYNISGKAIFKDTPKKPTLKIVDNPVDNYVDNLSDTSLNSENPNMVNLVSENQEIGYQDMENPNDNIINKNKLNNNKLINHQSIYKSGGETKPPDHETGIKTKPLAVVDYETSIENKPPDYETGIKSKPPVQAENDTNKAKEYEIYKSIIKRNIDYDEFFYKQISIETLNKLVEVMVNTVVYNQEPILINGSTKPSEVVKSILLKLRHNDILYVLHRFDEYNPKIQNFKAYAIVALYNAFGKSYNQQNLRRYDTDERYTL